MLNRQKLQKLSSLRLGRKRFHQRRKTSFGNGITRFIGKIFSVFAYVQHFVSSCAVKLKQPLVILRIEYKLLSVALL